MAMHKLIFASHNAHKTKEIAAIFNGLFQIASLHNIGFFEEIIESGDTLEENAAIKANAVFGATQLDCFADDTGLMVDALDGKPGVYTARYAGPERDANLNNQKLLFELQNHTNRTASFVTIIHLIFNGKSYQFKGELKGYIAHEAKGTEGFGYDPLFVPLGSDRTLAQMSLLEKNQLSHRAKAFQQMLQFFNEELT